MAMGGTVENSTLPAWRQIFSQAIRTQATDIHLEPQIDALIIRFRRQGRLTSPARLDAALAGPLTNELKQLAELDLKQTSSPQSGNFSETLNRHNYQLVIDTVPLAAGERLVIHIHDPLAQPPDLGGLGLWGNGLTHVQNALATPHGLILISGPNHSGVSTSLSSCASSLVSPLHHVASVEDRAAYHLAGVSYMSVNPTNGMIWSRVLKMQLKHEPDVVILGNVPDRTTASLATMAANQQQLILAGCRADTNLAALKQLVRLSDLPLELATSLRLMWNQRLLPKLCPKCREAYIPDNKLTQRLETKFHLERSGNLERLQQLETEARSQLDGDLEPAETELISNSKGLAKLWRARAGGCRFCHKSGYDGATALFEIVSITDELKRQLVSPTSSSALSEAIVSSRITSLNVDGLVKAVCGIIDIEAIL